MYFYQYEGRDSTWLGPTGKWGDVSFCSTAWQKVRPDWMNISLLPWQYASTSKVTKLCNICILIYIFQKTTQCCVTCWSWFSLPTASTGWGYSSRFVSTSEYTAMEIYLKKLFTSLLKKANLLEKHWFVLNSAAQRYFCQSLSKLENDCAAFYILSVTTCARVHSPSYLSTHTQHT